MQLKPVLALTFGIGALGLIAVIVFGGGQSNQSSMSSVGSEAGPQQGFNDVTGSDYISDRAQAEAADQAAQLAATGPQGDAAPVDLQARRPDQTRDEGNRRGGRGGRGDWSSRMEERIAEYDLNGDGALSKEERDAMMQSFRNRMVERMDADGDGFVDINEMISGRRTMMLDSPQGDQLRARYDTDGDGTLNEAEEAAMNASFAERDAERMKGLVERYDTDGDGEVSRAETEVMQQSWIDRQNSFFDNMTAQFDADGDGMLNIDERDTARADFSDRRAKDRFLDRYDANGDRTIDAADHERFIESYGAKEPNADVNRDGVINMDDLASYRDWAEAINSEQNP